ncbi:MULTISPECIES: hypothetical protein [unclassified Chryseobacterium]|uniref:hypothetical protein n=1 Tax=unclassified Chryseobacterium TaxID=2593645 RepID=UPI003019907A
MEGNFWSYFGSYKAWGGSADAAGNIYMTTASDGILRNGKNEIQEVIFTRTKLASVASNWFRDQQFQASVRQPGRAKMIGGLGDFFGFFDIAGDFVENNFSQDDQETFFAASLMAAVIFRKPRLALKELPLEENLAEDFIRVRHHTSLKGLKGIKRSGSIDAARGLPYGVDVEVSPFLKATKVDLGQSGTGSYIEFSIPKSQVGPPAPGYMGGIGNAGRIVTGGPPLNISNLAPKFVRWNWLGF